MRIISLDLLLGTPRLQRRIDAERAQLQGELAALKVDTRQLRSGVVQTMTSLPALAIAGLSGFAIAKLVRAPRRPVTDNTLASAETGAATSLLGLLWWQLLMPMAISWAQARFAPAEESEEQ